MDISSIRETEAVEYRITRSKLIMAGISSAGYDALCAILELEFRSDGQVWRFYDVPEHVWYDFRKTEAGDSFFHTNISGKYIARQIEKGMQ